MSFFEILSTYHEAFLKGLIVTVEMCLAVWAIGIVIGVPIGAAATRYGKTVGLPLAIISAVVSAIPVIVLLLWAHYPLQSSLNVVLNPLYVSIVVLGITNTIAVAEIVKNALKDLPRQYHEAALVSGLSRRTTTLRIVLPLAFRYALPSLLVTQINVLHLTLFTSLISVEELFRVSQRINSMIYRPVQIYTGLAVFFLLVCLPVHVVAQVLRRRYARDISER